LRNNLNQDFTPTVQDYIMGFSFFQSNIC